MIFLHFIPPNVFHCLLFIIVKLIFQVNIFCFWYVFLILEYNNIGGFMDYAVLQSTRLSIVHDMAYKIALVLKKIDFWLHHYKSNQSKSLIRKHNESV